MIGEQDVLGFIAPPAKTCHADVGVQALHQAAVRLADIRRGAPRFKTKDLVGLLLSHGARTWRNSLPQWMFACASFTPWRTIRRSHAASGSIDRRAGRDRRVRASASPASRFPGCALAEIDAAHPTVSDSANPERPARLPVGAHDLRIEISWQRPMPSSSVKGRISVISWRHCTLPLITQ